MSFLHEIKIRFGYHEFKNCAMCIEVTSKLKICMFLETFKKAGAKSVN